MINEDNQAQEEMTDEELEMSLEEYDEEALALAAENAESSEEEQEETAPEEEVIAAADVEGSELESFESADVEEPEEVELMATEQVMSILESILFSTDKAQSASAMAQAFRGTNIKTKQVKKALERLQVEYAGGDRGITLEEVKGGYQLRTKVDNMNYIKNMIKTRSFRLSGAALEVLSIAAYNQPCIKAQVDEIRGVESGHLLRGLMDRGLMRFAGKSELPGKPMLYETTSKFLEIFGLKSLNELPSLSEIDDLIPEGIGEEEEAEKLSDVTDGMSCDAKTSYSEGEEELATITGTLDSIDTSSEFFEVEKQRIKDKKEADKAQDIREALDVGEEVSTRDKNWLERYDIKMAELAEAEITESTEDTTATEESAEEAVLEASESTDEEQELNVADELQGIEFVEPSDQETDLDQALADEFTGPEPEL